MGTKMSTKLALLSVYEKTNNKLSKAEHDLKKHLDSCLDKKCCARVDAIEWTILALNTELECLLEDIKAL